jgi:rod shape-determining protein MreB
VLHRSGITTWLLRYFQSDLAIDLGMTNTVIYHCFDRRVVLDEPSMLTAERVRDKEWKILAVGSEARSMLGRTPEAVEAVRPMKDGVIADFFFAEKMLRYFVTKVLGTHVVRPSPRVLMCVPFSSTPVERHMFRECAGSTGARQVWLVSKSMAAAIGAGLPVSEARASVVLYVGGAITEIAVLSLARIVFASSVRLGGDRFDQAIISYVRQKHGVLIGEATAEHIKLTAGAARRGEEARTVTVKGRNPSEATLSTVVLSGDDIADALEEPLQALMNLLKDALYQTPPELLADAAERGIVLAGGGALLRGLDKLLAEKTGLPVILADDPTTCVARGAARIFELLEEGGHHFDLE